MLSPQLEAIRRRLQAHGKPTLSQQRLLRELEVLDGDSAVAYVLQTAQKRGVIAGEPPPKNECPACGAEIGKPGKGGGGGGGDCPACSTHA